MNRVFLSIQNHIAVDAEIIVTHVVAPATRPYFVIRLQELFIARPFGATVEPLGTDVNQVVNGQRVCSQHDRPTFDQVSKSSELHHHERPLHRLLLTKALYRSLRVTRPLLTST
ncbi:hypothetical protein FUT69_08275 [Xylella taiwanensis]|uniref:Uncharacterized protein n=1 Tax=Xylella taiwanensis TaxID=1444770 RepID=A0ABS8TS10_9GAMM|nr:hypothetical protein [Xylella taiwanensis]MCD8455513.1 hypothetical protein [Xylella taiwanensis]MCD8457920.1 hypothetical protein [Xylella taiwanensis]MCD8460055.1 hypothetical protein [Xylella taiwanensis]MCD8472844.1 hypothetical protein [Xylella taiwanensis]NBI37150.1 hypothetical protein [Xylella taiwanensis]